MFLPKFLYVMTGTSLALLGAPLSLRAAEWTWSWQPSPAENSVTAKVCPMKYGKKWAYTFDLDDQPHDDGVFAPDFFAQYHFTDAPPGVKGGKPLPIVGSMAVFPYRIGANSTYLSYDELKAIQNKGWGISNHGYMHKGRSYGDKPEELTPEEFRQELFWSQSVLASELGNGRAPLHFVFPNGYQAYAPYLKQFNLVSGSSAGGTARNLTNDSTNILSLHRNHMDEKAWTGKYAKGDPMAGFSPGCPTEGDIFIDMTHNLNIDPASENQKRWMERLRSITEQFGAEGSDDFWSGSTQEIVSYARAAKAAKVELTPGKLAVSFPDELPGSPLTIQLTGVPETTKIPVPDGGVLHRQGTTVWITSPMIGHPGSPMPSPRIKKVFEGPAAALITLPKPARVAGVQIRQHGPPAEIQVDLVQPDGSTKLLGKSIPPPGFVSGTLLFSNVPNSEAVLAQSVKISMVKGLKEVTIWALDE